MHLSATTGETCLDRFFTFQSRVKVRRPRHFFLVDGRMPAIVSLAMTIPPELAKPPHVGCLRDAKHER